MLLTLLDTGMRCSEPVQLTIDDLDLEDGRLRILHAKGISSASYHSPAGAERHSSSSWIAAEMSRDRCFRQQVVTASSYSGLRINRTD